MQVKCCCFAESHVSELSCLEDCCADRWRCKTTFLAKEQTIHFRIPAALLPKQLADFDQCTATWQERIGQGFGQEAKGNPGCQSANWQPFAPKPSLPMALMEQATRSCPFADWHRVLHSPPPNADSWVLTDHALLQQGKERLDSQQSWHGI